MSVKGKKLNSHTNGCLILILSTVDDTRIKAENVCEGVCARARAPARVHTQACLKIVLLCMQARYESAPQSKIMKHMVASFKQMI